VFSVRRLTEETFRREAVNRADAPETSRPASLKDVAARAGVSIKTVSNVVHDYRYVSETTRARVRTAIDELNYQPNMAARNLRGGRSGLIALAVPELGIPYFAEIARLVVEEAAKHGFTVLIDQTGGVREREQLFVSGIRPQLVDALIVTPITLTRDDLADRPDRLPIVMLGETPSDGLVDKVAIDSRKAGAAAVSHLIGLGRSRIAVIGAPTGPTGSSAHLRRLQGYWQALAEAGLRTDLELVAKIGAFRAAEGSQAMADLLALPEPPDAVFCFNDLLALGATRRLLTSGYRVPEDVAVMGFDDLEEGKYVTPTLSTVSPDKQEIARVAVARILSQLRLAAPGPPRSTEVPFRLIERESTIGRHPGV
jgi:DNA-binding LacI/PurR family transcriptional regulator